MLTYLLMGATSAFSAAVQPGPFRRIDRGLRGPGFLVHDEGEPAADATSGGATEVRIRLWRPPKSDDVDGIRR